MSYLCERRFRSFQVNYGYQSMKWKGQKITLHTMNEMVINTEMVTDTAKEMQGLNLLANIM